MTFRQGFSVGIVIGAIVTLFATGQIYTLSYSESVRSFALIILFLIFIFGLAVTAYNAMYRRSLVNPSGDGFIIGFGFVEATIVFLLYGRFW
jgi:energy-coupling factor transporter transmembrane protein EcfT